MRDFKHPTCGRMVHYFPNQADKTILKQEKCPAVVLNDDTYPDLFVMHVDGGGIRKSVPHTSAKSPEMGYWEWPEIK
jgi:hypothetical protein